MKPLDIQVNGYAGVDFCSLDLTPEQFHHACEEIRADGVDKILATVITDSIDNLEAKLSNLARIRESDQLVSEVVAGFHIEGPFLNAQPGFAGAHQPEKMRAGNIADAKRLIDSGGGLVKLITLAPERDPGFKTIEYLAEEGITVSAGHCNPTLGQLKGAVDHGLSMVTHFGNGCPVDLPRHDNVLQRFLHFRKFLWFCFIPDGVHIEFFALKNYLEFIGVEKCIVVTDAIAAAKMPPGVYQLSGITIEVDESGVARRPGSSNLAGSTITMPDVISHLKDELNLSEVEIERLISTNPRNALEKSG